MAIPARNLRTSALIIACLVALAAFLVYFPALRNDFVNWDDDDYVYSLALKPHFQVYYNRGPSYARLGMYHREAFQDFTQPFRYSRRMQGHT